MTTDRSLPRQERLRSLGAVRRLFESGQCGFIFPFRYLWFAEADSERSVEVLFSVVFLFFISWQFFLVRGEVKEHGKAED